MRFSSTLRWASAFAPSLASIRAPDLQHADDDRPARNIHQKHKFRHARRNKGQDPCENAAKTDQGELPAGRRLESLASIVAAKAKTPSEMTYAPQSIVRASNVIPGRTCAGIRLAEIPGLGEGRTGASRGNAAQLGHSISVCAKTGRTSSPRPFQGGASPDQSKSEEAGHNRVATIFAAHHLWCAGCCERNPSDNVPTRLAAIKSGALIRQKSSRPIKQRP
jgi:hypothetical protein